MHQFPHHYRVQAGGTAEGPVRVACEGVPDIATHAPPEFDGPPGYWSPEGLLVASVADCYILSFRAAARASRLAWASLAVDVEGVLERVDGVTRFTRFRIAPRLVLAAEASETLAQAVLQKAKSLCLVTNSLNAACELAPQVQPSAAA